MTSYYEYEQQKYGPVRPRITWAVQRLILINVLIYAGQLIIEIPFGGAPMAEPPGGVFTRMWFAFQPVSLLMGGLWKPITYMFIHGNLLHLFLNMLWLFFFGPDVERTLGTRQFIIFYFVCGALGVLATFAPLVLFRDNASVIGASGAVMGIMMAFAVINPERQLFLFPFAVPINARGLVIIVIVMNILTGLGGGSTSVATHLGGMGVGYAYMKLVPLLRRWRLEETRKRMAEEEKRKMDKVGEAVDNIFEFDERKRRR